MIDPKCRLCGKQLNPKTAYKIKEDGKIRYYCSEKEYSTWESICSAVLETVGEVRISTSWNDIREMVFRLLNSYSLEQILEYIMADSQRISDILSKKVFPNNYSMIKYYIGIVRNNIDDYIFEPVDDSTPQVAEDFYMAPFKYKPRKARRAMAEIERLEDEDGDLDDE